MRRLMVWSKTNPISVISAVAAVLCVGAIVCVQVYGTSFKAQTKKKAEHDIGRLDQLQRTSVEVPSADPNQPLVPIKIAINKAAIEKLTEIQEQMDREYDATFRLAVDRNQKGLHYAHVPMKEGLFPGPPRDSGMPYVAEDEYKRVVAEFTQSYLPDAPYPRLNAGRGLSLEKIQGELERFEDDHLRADVYATGGAEHSTEQQVEELRKRKRERLINLLEEHAQKIHIYVNTATRDEGSGKLSLTEDTPFYQGAWPPHGEKPTPQELWEAQLDLWIQQDIVEAIATTNRVDEPTVSVLTAPIKRLINIHVEPGYVGVTTAGAVGQSTDTSAPSARNRMGGGSSMMLRPGFGLGRGGPDDLEDPALERGGYGGEAEEEPDELEKPGGQTRENYEYSPTGRCSNALYDVRHAKVTVIIDSQRIPQFLDALSQVNLMTVLMANIRDVDEYEHLAGTEEGFFVYGQDDAVELGLVIETLWLRRWTAGHWDKEEAQRLGEAFEPGLMPDDVRQLLGLKRRRPISMRHRVPSTSDTM